MMIRHALSDPNTFLFVSFKTLLFIVSYGTSQLQPPILHIFPISQTFHFSRCTAPPFPFRREQASQEYQANFAQQDSVRTDRNQHIQDAKDKSSRGKGSREQAKESWIPSLKLLGVQQKPHAKQSQHEYRGPSADP